MHITRITHDAESVNRPAHAANSSELRRLLILATGVIDNEITRTNATWAVALADLLDEILLDVVTVAKARRTAKAKAKAEEKKTKAEDDKLLTNAKSDTIQ